MKKVYIIHENEEWIVPLRERFSELGTPYEAWDMDTALFDTTQEPPEGVFYNRMSRVFASARKLFRARVHSDDFGLVGVARSASCQRFAGVGIRDIEVAAVQRVGAGRSTGAADALRG